MPDLVIVAFVAALVFGAFQIPRIGDALGRLVRGRGGGDATRGPERKDPPADRPR